MADVIRNLPDADYHKLGDLSHSGAIDLLVSARRYRHRRDNPTSATAAMRLGTAVHAMVLQPSLVRDLVRAEPDVNKRTKAGKEELAEFTADLPPGCVVVSPADYRKAQAMADAVFDHPIAGPMIHDATDRELTIRWERDGIPLRARLDLIAPWGVADVKTTRDANRRWFNRAAARFGYHVQAAWYLEAARAAGLPCDCFRLLCVESVEPYDVIVYEVGEDMIQAGEAQMRAALRVYAECMVSGVWPGYPQEIHRLQFETFTMEREQEWADEIGGPDAAPEDPF